MTASALCGAQDLFSARPAAAAAAASRPVRCEASCSSDAKDWWGSIGQGALGSAAAAAVLFADLGASGSAVEGYETYYGTAASASSYGGYGGNASKRDSAEYVYDVPAGWKERNISKVEKGTNGTDSEFFNPSKKREKTYLTYLAGFRKLPPQENVLNNLALSDVNLQDQIGEAENINSTQRTADNGQVYYDFEIDSPVAHNLIAVTCTNNKLYAHFVMAPNVEWGKDKAMLQHIHESFQTTGNAS
eukprot:SM000141S00847  [mRNA]  locus=s141:48956:50459:- [translate_table: standard]